LWKDMKRGCRLTVAGCLMMLIGMAAGHLYLPGPAAAVTPAGTMIPSVSSVSCVMQGVAYRFDSNLVNVRVPQFYKVSVAPPGSGFAKPGQSATFTHTVSNRGNVPDTFSLEAVAPPEVSASFFAADKITPLADTDGDGRIDTGLLPSGAELTIVVKVAAAPTAKPGTKSSVAIKATSTGDGSATAGISESVDIINFWSPTNQEVVPSGQVPQGTTLTYTYTFGNDAPVAATNVVITDTLDPSLSFIAGSAEHQTSSTGATSDYRAEDRTVRWTLPSIPPKFIGTVSFKARVDAVAASEATIRNTFRIKSDENPETEVSNTVVSPIVEQPLRVLKIATVSEAEVGDFVGYAVTVENISKMMTAKGVQIADVLPKGFRYAKGSSTLDNIPVADPALSTGQTWAVGDLEPGKKRILTYRAIVSIDAPLGNGVNTALAVGASAAGYPLQSPSASAKVKVLEGVLNEKAIILGRVFVDLNRDRMPDESEPGLKGVRLYLENGFYAITDGEGKFSIVGVDPGEHVLKLDRSTLPPGLEPTPLDSTFAGDGGSRFISLPFGGTGRGDFGLVALNQTAVPIQEQAKNPPKEERVYVFGTRVDAAPPSLEQQIASMPATPEILEPAPKSLLRNPWSDIVVRVPNGWEYTLRVNDMPLLEKQIGKTIVDPKRNIRVCQYVGVKLQPGVNRLALEVTPPDGQPQVSEIEVTAVGEPDKLQVTPEKGSPPADGKTTVAYRVTFVDKDNHQVTGDIGYTVFQEKGEILEPDQDPGKAGHQLKAVDGKGSFTVRSTMKTGTDRITVIAGSELKGGAEVFYTPQMRDWLVTGLGSLTMGVNSVSGNTTTLTRDDKDRFEKGFDAEGRFAFFAKGTLLDQYLVTAAYDNKKTEPPELFQRMPPDRYYPIYGDASVQGYEAESQKRYYLKVEKERSSLLIGDFNTNLSASEFSRYDRAFNGVRADLDTSHATLRAFGTSTTHAIHRDEIPGNGTSGYYFLSRQPIIENTDRIRIEIRDRYHSERVLSSVEKTPYTDYSLDQRTGALLFREPVPSYDPNLNPIRIVAIYESDAPGDDNNIYGGRGAVRSGQGSELGLTAVVEENGSGNNTLLGADGVLRITDKSSLKVEAARTDTVRQGEGLAYKTEFGVQIEKALVDAYYRRVDKNFDNPSMSGSELGSEKYGGKLTYPLLDTTKLMAEGFVHSDLFNDTTLTNATLGVSHRLQKFTLTSGYRYVEGPDDQGTVRTSNMVLAGVSGKLSERLEGSLLQEQAFNSATVKEYPSRTLLKLNYKLSDATKIFATEEYRESGRDQGHNTILGISSKLYENVVVTTSYRERSGTDSDRQLGTEVTSKWEPSKAVWFTTKTGYQLENSMTGDRGQALLGVESSWEVQKGLRVGAKAERVQLVTGNNDPNGINTALALSAAYLPDDTRKATARYEFRDSPGETTNLGSLGGAWKLNRYVSLLGKANFWSSNKPTGTDTLFDAELGGAYRPLGRESLYLLGLLRFKEDNKGSTPMKDDLKSLIGSFELSDRVSPTLTAHGKYAGKYSWENVEGQRLQAYTDMLIAGLTYDLTERWDLDLSTRVMNQYQSGVTAFGIVPQVSYLAYKNVKVALGYNFAKLNDRDLSGEDYSAQGPFIQLKMKFDEITIRDVYASLTAKEPAPQPPLPAAAPAPVAAPLPKPEPVTYTAVVRALLFGEPAQIVGSAEALKVMVNDREVALPTADVKIASASADDLVERKGDDLGKPLAFQVTVPAPERVTSWRIAVASTGGAPVHTIRGTGAPPASVPWDAGDGSIELLSGGEIYQYRLELEYLDGSRVTSPVRVFGLNRTSSFALSLTGSAFETGSARLSRKAMAVLKKTAVVLRQHPQEKIVVEGHTDSVGSDEMNLELSRKRSQAAADHLVNVEKIPAERLVVRWFGKTRPIASNAIAEGRELNRRVEIKGEFSESKRTQVLDQHREQPFARIAGKDVTIDGNGRFAASDVPLPLQLELGNAAGRSVKASVAFPEMVLVAPGADGSRIPCPGPEADQLKLPYRFVGKTRPGHAVSLGGENLKVAEDGSFSFTIELAEGETVRTLQVRDQDGLCRQFTLKATMSREVTKGSPEARTAAAGTADDGKEGAKP
jgi:uncharacterized repeat protein (TIGR01451 family)